MICHPEQQKAGWQRLLTGMDGFGFANELAPSRPVIRNASDSAMRLRKPHPAELAEVTITRGQGAAVIEFLESGIAPTQLQIGPRVRSMTDLEILECFNASLRDEQGAVDDSNFVVLEIPPGHRQLEFFAAGQQWVPRGAVVRCVVDDSGPGGEAVVYVDDVELSLDDFGKMLATFSGWGMRVCFVPQERLNEPPAIEVGEPE